MRFINTLWIFLILGFGGRIFAMDQSERSLPAGTNLSANVTSAMVAVPKVDPEVRRKKLAELEKARIRPAEEYSDGVRWSEQRWNICKSLLKEALENFEIHPNDIKWWSPLLQAIRQKDDQFSQYLIKKGASPKGFRDNGDPIEWVESLPIAKLLILKGEKKKDGFNRIIIEPKIALLHYKYGTNIVLGAHGSFDPMSSVMQFYITNGEMDVNKVAEFAKVLIGLGAPLDNIILEGEYAGFDCLQLLELIPKENDKKKLQEAITHSIENNVSARENLNNEFAAQFPRGVTNIIVSYLGHIVPDDIYRQADEVDHEADQMLLEMNARSRADKGDEKESTKSNCVIM